MMNVLKPRLTAIHAASGLALSLVLVSTQAALPTGITVTRAMGTSASNFKFRNPVWLGEIPGKDGYYAVIEQVTTSPGASASATATIQAIRDSSGTWVKKTLLSIPVRGNGDETGLLSMAFHPDYANNGRYYIYYTALIGSAGYNILERRTTDASRLTDNGSTPDTLLGFSHSAGNHHGGGLAFGPDGMLYLSIGDNATSSNAQDLTNLLGKVLRLDVDNQDAGLKYAIPADNPLTSSSLAGVRKEIWAYGFRNPWRLSFDKVTGNLWLGDVGSDGAKRAEEVNLVRKGMSYGWPCREGNQVQAGGNCNSPVDPVAFYLNSLGWSNIVGGMIYRGKTTSAFYGHYLFGHYSSTEVRIGSVELNDTVSTGLAWSGTTSSYNQLSHLFTDSKGRVYFTTRTQTGEIFQLVHADLTADTGSTPQPPAPPTGVSVTVGVNKVTLTFTPSAGATSHTVYYSKGTTTSKTSTLKITSATSPQEITGLPDSTFAFGVTATNAQGESNLSAVVTAKPLAPLVLTSASLPSGRARTAYGPVALAASGGQSPYTFAVTSGTLPAGLTLSTAGSLAGTPTQADSAVYEFTVTDAGARTAKKNLSLRIWPNRAPKITSAATAKASGGSVFLYTATASDSDGNTLTFTYRDLPAWLTASGAQASGTPGDNDNAATFWVLVSDGALKDSLQVSLTVSHTNKPPVIDSALAARDTVPEGDSAWFRIVSHDPDSDPLTVSWRIDSLAPVAGSARYTFKPDFASAGKRSVQAIVTDPDGATVTHRFDIVVKNVALPPQCLPPSGDVRPADGFTLGWAQQRDPDIDSTTQRFQLEAYRDSTLTDRTFTKDSLPASLTSDMRKPIENAGTLWVRVAAWDAQGDKTGFGSATRYRFTAPVALNPGAARAFKQRALRKALQPGQTPTYRKGRLETPTDAAGRHLRE